MGILKLHNTALADWHDLILEAERNSTLYLSEELESYLVYLLMRFSKNSSLSNSILALDFLNSLELIGKQRQVKFQELGDKCLLLAGLFPERAIRKHVSTHYFIDMGQLAFNKLDHGELRSIHPNLIYRHLCDEFVRLVQILQATRPSSLAARCYLSTGST